MPHNLYLHTAIVQSRNIGETVAAKREAIRFAGIDSTIALSIALVINSSILILAAATFHQAGKTEVAEIQEAYKLLAPMLGLGMARSEEHTSELQSLMRISYAVFRLKKKIR